MRLSSASTYWAVCGKPRSLRRSRARGVGSIFEKAKEFLRKMTPPLFDDIKNPAGRARNFFEKKTLGQFFLKKKLWDNFF